MFLSLKVELRISLAMVLTAKKAILFKHLNLYPFLKVTIHS